MKSLVFIICIAVVCGTDPVRRFRKVFHVPEDSTVGQDTTSSTTSSTEVVAEDIFERLLHAEWNSFSYNYHTHNHGHVSSHHHYHNHHHNHHHSNQYYDDDYYNTGPYSVDDDADFVAAGSSEEITPQPTFPKVYPQDFTTAPSPAVAVEAQEDAATTQPSLSLVTAQEVEETTSPTVTPATDEPTTNLAACSAFSACAGFAGDCCPNAEGVFKACCFGVTYPPLVAVERTESPVKSPTASPVEPTESPITRTDTPVESPTSSPPIQTTPGSPVPDATGTSTSSGGDAGMDSLSANTAQRTELVLEKCGVSVDERSLQLLTTLMNPSDDLDEGSPQREAFEWMDNADGLVVCGDDDTLSQRYNLAVTYFALDGSAWKNCSTVTSRCETAESWMSPTSECDWFGVACDASSDVTMLTLKDNGLSGDLPTELFSLSKLSALSLDHNKRISGSIPTEIGQLTALNYIELDDNSMTGPLPDELYDLTTLQALDLNDNLFNGTIDDNISSLSDLMVLQLENNAFTGPIPWFGLAMLKNLLLMYIHGNDFDDGSLEPICNLLDSRRSEYAGYLQFMAADCASIACSCCKPCVCF